MPRILVVAPNWIGDALMAQPLLARLREKLPQLRLDVLAPALDRAGAAAHGRGRRR
jgi:heptosyltransferase-2